MLRLRAQSLGLDGAGGFYYADTLPGQLADLRGGVEDAFLPWHGNYQYSGGQRLR